MLSLFSSNDCQSQLVGFLCSSTKSLEWMNTNFPIVIDVNHEQLKCRKYVGKFLQPLANNNCRNFPSDESAIAYLVSLITDIQQYTLLAKYTSPKSVIHLLKLSDADQLILLNSLIELNVAKYSFLKTDVHQIASRLPLRVVRLWKHFYRKSVRDTVQIWENSFYNIREVINSSLLILFRPICSSAKHEFRFFFSISYFLAFEILFRNMKSCC